MSSIRGRILNLSFTTPPLGGISQLRERPAPTRTSSLVTWLGDKGLALHLPDPPAEELVYAPDAPATPVNYRVCGLTLQAKLGDGGKFPLKPVLAETRVDGLEECEIFQREEDWDRALLLTCPVGESRHPL